MVTIDIGHTKYTDAEAIAAVEGEATLALSGALTVAGAYVFNEAGADVDGRFEGSSNQNLLVLDAGLDVVAIGGAAVSGKQLSLYGTLSFPQATTIETTDGALTLVSDSGLVQIFDTLDMETQTVRNLLQLRGRNDSILSVRANLSPADVTAQRLTLETIDTVGNANILGAYLVPTGTETTPFFAQRGDVTTPLTGTLDASFLAFRWNPSDDVVTVFVNDGGTIRSVAIGTVT